MNDIATAIRTARLAAPMTQDQLARAAGVTRKTVVRAERGHALSAETLMALASVLHLDASDLAGLPSGPVDAPEPPDLVAMVLRGDEDEARRRTLASLAGEALALVPGASSMAVPDPGLWERRTVGALAPDGALPPGAGVREASDLRLRHRAYVALEILVLIGLPSLALVLVSFALSGVAWAGAALDQALRWLPPPDTDLGAVVCAAATICILSAWAVCFLMASDAEGRLGAAVRAGRTAAEGVELLRVRAYVTGRDGLHALTLVGNRVEAVLVPPSATSGFEIRDHDGVTSLTFHMAAGREVPEGKSWVLETLGFGCREMALPCLRTGPAFVDGLSAYHRIVRPRGVERIPSAAMPLDTLAA